MDTMKDPTIRWVIENLTGNALSGTLAALGTIPDHRVPQVQLDSQSPWINVDAIPGPRLAVWIATGAVYKVGDDGAVGDDPIALGGKRDQ